MPSWSASAPLAAAALLGAMASAVDAQPMPFRNVTAGGPLRHGVYGRIEVRGPAPPPVIYSQPVIARPTLERQPLKEPIYLYVPPGQVRKWKQNCARWKACDRPVLFVRMDKSPSRWGKWRHLRDDDGPQLRTFAEGFALQDRSHD